jgi:hypothetical protein
MTKIHESCRHIDIEPEAGTLEVIYSFHPNYEEILKM